MSRVIDPVNESELDEVDIVMMCNEDCDDLVDSEPEEVQLTEDDGEPDEDVADVMYDDIKDDASTIEDMAAQDFRNARDCGIETDLDDDVVDIIYDEEEDDFEDEELEGYDESVEEDCAELEVTEQGD